jgi:catechol 2,3-dioxygenase-like lactoylglutathione lyase family enzyme
MVTLERPSSDELAQFARDEKYKILRDNTARLKERLLTWLEEQRLSKDVIEAGEPTAFNVLFFNATDRGVDALSRAPGVAKVCPANEFQVDLPEPTEKGPLSKTDLWELDENSPRSETGSHPEGGVMSHIVGLAEIVLWTADMEKSLAFYRDLLGLQVISSPELPNVFLKVGEGHAGTPQMIVLVPLPPEAATQPRGGQLHHLAFELPPESFDVQRRILEEAGLKPRGGIHPVLPSRTMYVDDPDGNEIEFISMEQ